MASIRFLLGLAALIIAVGVMRLHAEEVRAAHGETAPAPGPAANTSSIRGRVSYGGEPPEPKLLQIPVRLRVRREGLDFDSEAIPERQRLNERGVLDESLLVGPDRGIANVIVYLWERDAPAPQAPPRRGPVMMRALHARLSPHVLVYWNTSPLTVVNDSGGGINFNWMHYTNRVLNDGQRVELADISKRALPYPTRVTDSLRPWVSSYILPLNHPYFAITGEDGRFEIKGLPAGVRKFVMWHEREGFLTTDLFQDGRFTLVLDGEDEDLGDFLVDPKSVANDLWFRQMPTDTRTKKDRNANALSNLHQAVIANDKPSVEHLVRTGNPNQREPRLNATALHYACRSGHEEIVTLLLDRKADVNARDVNQCTPLHWAAKGGRAAVIRILAQSKAEIDAVDSRGWTALHFAAERGYRDVVRLLEELGADPRVKNRDGKTARELSP